MKEKENKIIRIDPIYIKYRKMWKEERWKFSGEMVKLKIKKNKSGLDSIEEYTLDVLNRIEEENGGNWLE